MNGVSVRRSTTYPLALLVAAVALGHFTNAAAAPPEGVKERDGLLLRVGLGGGALGMQREGHLSAGSASYYTGDSKIGGGTGAFELTLGGTLASGLVVGGTVLTYDHQDAVLESDNEPDVAVGGPLQFILLGPSLDYFPNPRGGFHFGGTAGIAGAWFKAPNNPFVEYHGGAGGGISLSAGYLWWIANQWSVGFTARITGARIHGEHKEFGFTGSEDDTLSAFTVMVTGAYH